MIDTEDIKKVVSEFMEGTDMFLVDINNSGNDKVEVVIDSDTTVSIDTCVELSRAINNRFDKDIEDFELTVSSAGLSQPVKLVRQYRKYLDKDMEVLLKNGEKYEGKLIVITENSITLKFREKRLMEGKKRKQEVEVVKEILLTDIKSAKPVISFK